MTTRQYQVQTTADALVSVRSNRKLMEAFGIEDRYAHLFVTPEGRRMAWMAQSVDSIYVTFNLARYKWFGENIARAAGLFDQLLFIGVGFDTRPIWQKEIIESGVRVFEVDYPEKLAYKWEVLSAHCVDRPHRVVSVPVNIAAGNLQDELEKTGFDRTRKTFVVMEGLTFFLDENVVRVLLSPDRLQLAPGSEMVFDCWTRERQQAINAKVKQLIGIELFGSFPFGNPGSELERDLTALGYTEVTVTPLESLAMNYGLDWAVDSYKDSWNLVSVMRK